MASDSMISIIERVKEYEDVKLDVDDVVFNNFEDDDRIGVITKVVVGHGYYVLWDDGDTGFYSRYGIEKIEGCTCTLEPLFSLLGSYKPRRKG